MDERGDVSTRIFAKDIASSETSQHKKIQIVALIKSNLEAATAGAYTLQDLLHSLTATEYAVASVDSLAGFLSRNFGTSNLKEIARGIKESSESSADNQKSIPEKARTLEVNEIRDAIFVMFDSGLSKKQIKLNLADFISSGKFPPLEKLLKMFKAKSLMELTAQLFAQWDTKKQSR